MNEPKVYIVLIVSPHNANVMSVSRVFSDYASADNYSKTVQDTGLKTEIILRPLL